jgi:cysteine synthase B
MAVKNSDNDPQSGASAFVCPDSTIHYTAPMHYPSLDELIGNTPLVKLRRLEGASRNTVLAKLEGNNPAGSVKDRPALGMIRGAEERGELRPGDTLIEATSGNTGIALAMVAAARGYSMVLIMPEHMSVERRAVMQAFGAKIILVSQQGGMEEARDLADAMQARGEGRVLDQFANADNPRAHYESTGPEIWRDTRGSVTHFVSAMGTTGTIMGVSRYLKEVKPDVQIIGVQPGDESSIPGIRKWPQAYLPKIYDAGRIDRIVEISAEEAERTTLELGRREGIFAGISSGGAASVALQLSRELSNAVIVTIVCDRGDRYLSTGLFTQQ